MVFALLKYGLGLGKFERQFPKRPPLKSSYDVVIIGGGGHGVATAYYLARDFGITNVAILERGYLGGGNTGHVFGSVVGKTVFMNGVTNLHYDEALNDMGLINNYQLVSWVEDTR